MDCGVPTSISVPIGAYRVALRALFECHALPACSAWEDRERVCKDLRGLIDVLRLIANGNANKQIADQLSIGEASVKSYVANILSKLGASDRAHAVTIGLKRGIIELEIP